MAEAYPYRTGHFDTSGTVFQPTTANLRLTTATAAPATVVPTTLTKKPHVETIKTINPSGKKAS